MGGVRGRLALCRRDESEVERQRSGGERKVVEGLREKGKEMERKACGMILDESGEEESM